MADSKITIIRRTERGRILEAEYSGAKIKRVVDGKLRDRPFMVWLNGEVMRTKRTPCKSAKTRMFGSIESASKAVDAEIMKRKEVSQWERF